MSSTPDLRRGDFACARCHGQTWQARDVAAHDGRLHKTLAMQQCAGCGLLHPAHHTVLKTAGEPVDVAKDIDTSDTALARQDLDQQIHKPNCPRDLDPVDGRCPRCQPDPDSGPVAKTLADLRALARNT